MKLLLVCLNAKYVHNGLGVRYLYEVTKNICNVEVCEFSINDHIQAIERDILNKSPDVVAFSCYIWNISYVLNLCSDIKKSNNNIKIILGGPEVSYDADVLLSKYEYIDYVVKGEGEIVFPKLIKSIYMKTSIPDNGVSFRKDGMVIDLPVSPCVSFDDIPFPYPDDLNFADGKILYYESSRGCPYSCKYCLSGEKGNVRFKDIDKVKKDLQFFDANNVPLVKFVDRTFNAHKKRANELWEYIATLKGCTRFHMEITGELLDDESINILEKVDSSKLQFEIGVQSTNIKTLDAIDRKCDKSKLFFYIKQLLERTDIHIHLDLIAGLPFEDLESFKKSFNEVVSLQPHVLQLGFLKLLKGSAMRDEAETHGIIYRDYAPYEIISNKYMSSYDILLLKDIDFVFDKVYNSGDFKKTIKFLFNEYSDKFYIFEKLAHYFDEMNLINKSLSKQVVFDNVYGCFSYLGNAFEEVIRYDYINALHPGKMPEWSRGDSGFRVSEPVFDFLKNEEYKKAVMPKYFNVPAKMLIKHFRFEKFDDVIVAFDYKTNEIYDVTSYINYKNE